MMAGLGRGAKVKPVPRKRPTRAPWDGRPLVKSRPPEYVRRWHNVNDWAREALEPADVEEFVDPWRMGNRVYGWRGNLIADPFDSEQAWDTQIPVEMGLNFIPPGPGHNEGGIRRVAIRAYTWTPDEDLGAVYDEKWITTGQAQTAKRAVEKHRAFIRNYMRAVKLGVASRRLTVTAWEIVFWTASKNADYV